MSTIGTTLPAAAANGTSSTASTTGSAFTSLTPSDFVNMMVTQLQNQDPLDPTNSQDLLAQMSQIGQLQASTQLQTTLTGLSLQNQIGAASSLIGKTVQGTDVNNNTVTGTVSSVTISQVPATSTAPASTSVTLNLNNGGTLPLSSVTAIAPAAVPATAATGAASTTPTAPPAVATPTTSTANAAAVQQVVAVAAAQNTAIASDSAPTGLTKNIVSPSSSFGATLA